MKSKKKKSNFIKKIFNFFQKIFSKKQRKDNQNDDIYPLW